MDCPNCGLINPPTTERCDCGYDFGSLSVKQSYLTERDKRLFTKSRLGFGFVAAYVLLRLVILLMRFLSEKK
jgi:hypothetical protein